VETLLEQAGDTIRLSHYTVQEFLRNPCSRIPKDSILWQLSDRNGVHTRLATAYLKLICPGNYYAIQDFDYHLSQCDVISPHCMELLEKVFNEDSETRQRFIYNRSWFLQIGDTKTLYDRLRNLPSAVSLNVVLYITELFDIPEIRQRWLSDPPPPLAMHLACATGCWAAIDHLLSVGCDIHERYSDWENATPLYVAAANRHTEIVQRLIERGADVNAKGGPFDYALKVSLYHGDLETMRLLIDNGANVKVFSGEKVRHSRNPGFHEEGVVEMLLGAGADIDADSYSD